MKRIRLIGIVLLLILAGLVVRTIWPSDGGDEIEQIRYADKDYGEPCDYTAPFVTNEDGDELRVGDCVTVFFGTNRDLYLDEEDVADNARDQLILNYGNSDAGALSYGKAEIWVPAFTDVEAGEERPVGDIDYLDPDNVPETEEERATKFYIARITKSGDQVDFEYELTDAVWDDGKGAIMLHIHGYKERLDDTLVRTAQMWTDFERLTAQDEDSYRFDDAPYGGFGVGAPVLFTWPSKAKLLAYGTDRTTAAESAVYLKEFLDILVDLPDVERINVIAHSMGNRVLLTTLETYVQDYIDRYGDDRIEFRFIFAAADVDEDFFENAAGEINKLDPNNVTIYSSERDLALMISVWANAILDKGFGFLGELSNKRRIGSVEAGRPYIYAANESYRTIDASAVSGDLIGHGYFSTEEFVVGDIYCALRDVPEDERALTRRDLDGQVYYQIDKEADPQDTCSVLRTQVPGEGTEVMDLPEPITAPPPPPPEPLSSCDIADMPIFVYFDPDSTVPGLDAQDLLDELTALLMRGDCVVQKITITGLIEAEGAADNNQQLAERRANAVRDMLTMRGVSDNLIVVETRLETELTLSEPRVEIIVSAE